MMRHSCETCDGNKVNSVTSFDTRFNRDREEASFLDEVVTKNVLAGWLSEGNIAPCNL